ncbi:hypothetical protein FE633_41695 [Streptomyces montanus]|uniref:Uncharacterized protein n=1 Tax=Streptomyces montanus TaxID=2580423 RepID=A0A5R9FHQ8_9ACTN|nr:hypothetical protein [Streptomyces montanus]TLS40393.1 hypothetical protein FE633_41695 [Streptomyces montanus]
MPIRALQLLFRLSVIGFLTGGFLIVIGQALGLALGDAGWVAAVEEHAGPAVFIVAGVSGLLAFVLSYLTTEELPGTPTTPQDLQPAAVPRPK